MAFTFLILLKINGDSAKKVIKIRRDPIWMGSKINKLLFINIKELPQIIANETNIKIAEYLCLKLIAAKVDNNGTEKSWNIAIMKIYQQLASEKVHNLGVIYQYFYSFLSPFLRCYIQKRVCVLI